MREVGREGRRAIRGRTGDALPEERPEEGALSAAAAAAPALWPFVRLAVLRCGEAARLLEDELKERDEL